VRLLPFFFRSDFAADFETCAYLIENVNVHLPSVSAHDGTSNRAPYPVFPIGGMEGILGILWTTIVKPVIQKLGYMVRSTLILFSKQQFLHRHQDTTIHEPKCPPPHVTWCTTGSLAFLPLHAAGCYAPDMQATSARAYDYIVSSYTPSVSALIKDENANSHAFSGLVAISQSFTSDDRLNRLPGTIDEVEKIRCLFPEKDFTWLKDSESTKDTVLKKMTVSSWLHLACHGLQRKDKPMESAFMLYDEPLNLYTISQQNLRNARLAFLSACQTATGEEKVPNEAAHLAAGMLMIGYHSVIGTMWTVRDQDAPIVAEEFYKYLITHDMKTEKGEVAYALHEAVGRLRDRIGTENFAQWVPFIHLGI
jgi:hypothetical protein